MAASWHDVLTHTEWVSLVFMDGNKPHVVASWGEYIRKLSPEGSELLVIPAGHYHHTESVIQQNNHVQAMLASRQVAGSFGPGQGYLLQGKARIETDGELAKLAKENFPWARGVLIVEVQTAQAQL